MKLKAVFYFCFFAALLASCSSNEMAPAHVFERKSIQNDKLMIKYRFNAGNKEITDSATVDNRVINGDSITVSFDKNNPANSSPQLHK